MSFTSFLNVHHVTESDGALAPTSTSPLGSYTILKCLKIGQNIPTDIILHPLFIKGDYVSLKEFGVIVELGGRAGHFIHCYINLLGQQASIRAERNKWLESH